MKLTKVIYIGRHGERSPLKYPSFLNPESFLNKDWDAPGLLTSKGAETQYKRGQYLRSKYKELFNSSHTQINCQSSNLDRTIDSGFYLLSGLLNLSFISPHTISKKEKIALLEKYGAKLKPLSFDVLYRGYFADIAPGIVPIYVELNETAYSKKEHFEKLAPIVNIASKYFEINKTVPMDYFGVFYLYDLLESYRANDKPYPEGFEDGKVYNELKFIHFYLLYNLMFISDTIRRLTNHYLYKEIISTLTNNTGPSFHYYSSHDSNLFSFILGLGYNINEVPLHSSGFTIELYESPEGKFVNFDYRGQNFNKVLFSDVSTEYVPLDRLLEKLRKECFKDDEEYKANSGNKEFDYVRDYVNAKLGGFR